MPTNEIFSENSSNMSEFKTETKNAGIMVISQAYYFNFRNLAKNRRHTHDIQFLNLYRLRNIVRALKHENMSMAKHRTRRES